MSEAFERAEVRRVDASDHRALCELFERCDSRCYCRYWHFAGDKNAWLERYARASEESARELGEELLDPVGAPHGVVALAGERLVGWMKVTPALHVGKLYEQRLYRGLPCFEGDRRAVYSIGCVLIDPEARRRGLSRRLLEVGIAEAQAAGARAVEAFPRRAEGLAEHELWSGPFDIFAEAGFRAASDLAPYPVLRLDLVHSVRPSARP